MDKLSDLALFDVKVYENIENFILTKDAYQSSILKEEFWTKILNVIWDDDEFNSLLSSLEEQEKNDYLEVAVDCFLTFYQANFTGPNLSDSLRQFLDGDLFKDDFKQLLVVNSEEINYCTKYPVLLYVSKRVFKFCDSNSRWLLRSIMVHQQVLEETCYDLLKEVEMIAERLKSKAVDKGSLAEEHIEMACLYHLFRNIQKSDFHLNKAKECLEFEFQLIGKMGKRTKHQQDSLSQLALEVTVAKNEAHNVLVPKLAVTHDVDLDDDVRLNNVQYDNEHQSEVIFDLEQKFLLAFVHHTLISRPQENLYMEEIRPILDELLLQNNCWAVRNVVLLIRSKMEFGNSHSNQRSLSQYEEIIKSTRSDSPNVLYRLIGMFSVNLKPIWKVEAEWANTMLKMGLVKASLDIFLRLQLWEEAVVCYNLLQLRGRAAEVIREQLEKNPTVKLWCLLGDATDDESCYEKAWKLSNETSSRAQRHWGNYYYFRKQYGECLSHFKISTDINCLQETILLRYGFAALETENWQTAVKVYKLYTSLEMDNFQVWNNLAKAQIKVNNLNAAHRALKEAVKCNYENWKVWDNLLVVSSDTKNFDDVILSYNRLLDLKGEYLCVEVLAALIRFLFGNQDLEEDQYQKLFKKTCTLFGRINSISPRSGQIMELYAQLAPNKKTMMDRLLKAHNNYLAIEKWYSETEPINKVVDISVELGQTALDDEINPKDPALVSVNRSLNTVISLIKRHVYTDATHWLDRVDNVLQQLQTKMGTTTS